MADEAQVVSRPWSGWRRLWVVLSVLLGAPILAFSFAPYSDYKYLEKVPLYEIRYQAEDAIRNDMNCYRGRGQWRSYAEYPAQSVKKIVTVRPPYVGQDSASYAAESPPKELWGKEVEQPLYNVSVSCLGNAPQWWWWMAVLPALFMAIVGFIARWVNRGFRPTS